MLSNMTAMSYTNHVDIRFNGYVADNVVKIVFVNSVVDCSNTFTKTLAESFSQSIQEEYGGGQKKEQRARCFS